MAVPRLKEKYLKEIAPALREQFGYKSVMQVPKVTKVTLNMGDGRRHPRRQGHGRSLHPTGADHRAEAPIQEGPQVGGQLQAARRHAGGLRVTLRGDRMYEMLDRLISIALPRIRDFRGISPAAFDGRGNYNLGVREQIIFPEIDYDKIDRIRGLDIAITTTAKTDEEGRALLRMMGMPFRES